MRFLCCALSLCIINPIAAGVAVQVDAVAIEGAAQNDAHVGRSDVVPIVRMERPRRHMSRHHAAHSGKDQMMVQMMETGAMYLARDRHLHHKHRARAIYTDMHPSAEPPTSLESKEGNLVPPPLELLPHRWREKLNHFEDLAARRHGSKEPEHDDDIINAADDDEDKALHSGFQERGDEWRAHERGYEWRNDHDSRDETDDDDWDDEDNKPVAKGFNGNTSVSSTATDEDTDDDDVAAYANADLPVVNVTAEEDATAPANTGPLEALSPNEPTAPPPESDVEKLGEGIGAMAYARSPTGSRGVNYDLRKRLQFQDFATICLLFAVFGLTVLLSCCSVYHVAEDPSPVAYYSEPKSHQQRVVCESSEVDAFLTAFNTQPQNARLRIIGKNPEPGGFRRFLRSLHPHTMRPHGLAALIPVRQRRRLPILFDVALDLTPFVTGDGRVSEDNLDILQKYLDTKNRLETVIIQKHVDWDLWEDFATNIRQRLRSLGFPGDVEVRFEAYDEVLIYQNQKWSNFVRNRVTQALVVISIVGSVVWVPYVWARSKTTRVSTRFRINVDPARYWDLVSEGLSAAEGFRAS
jgi:hypothetical protein